MIDLPQETRTLEFDAFQFAASQNQINENPDHTDSHNRDENKNVDHAATFGIRILASRPSCVSVTFTGPRSGLPFTVTSPALKYEW